MSPSGNLTIEDGVQEGYAARICKEYGARDVNNQSDSVSKMFGYGYNHFYRYMASWIPDCQMKYGQSIDTFSANCSQVMISNFRKCRSLATVNVRANIYNTGNNGGQGGHTDIQCLRYQYVSTRHAVCMTVASDLRKIPLLSLISLVCHKVLHSVNPAWYTVAP